MDFERYKQIQGEGSYQTELLDLEEKVKRKIQRLAEYRKLPITHPDYINDHFLYLRLENECDEAIHQFLKLTGKGRLNENGYYFK